MSNNEARTATASQVDADDEPDEWCVELSRGGGAKGDGSNADVNLGISGSLARGVRVSGPVFKLSCFPWAVFGWLMGGGR